ncbi:hypothetical protein Tco_0145262 [Tanacetum coccineum]
MRGNCVSNTSDAIWTSRGRRLDYLSRRQDCSRLNESLDDSAKRQLRGLFSKNISNEKADYMVHEVTNGEIKDVMFSIDNDKALGPDGFTSLSINKSWDLVGNDVCILLREGSNCTDMY